jgi:hypothetical protein
MLLKWLTLVATWAIYSQPCQWADCCIQHPKSSNAEKEIFLARIEWLPVTSRSYKCNLSIILNKDSNTTYLSGKGSRLYSEPSTATVQPSVFLIFFTSATIPVAASLAARVDTATHTLRMTSQSWSDALISKRFLNSFLHSPTSLIIESRNVSELRYIPSSNLLFCGYKIIYEVITRKFRAAMEPF